MSWACGMYGEEQKRRKEFTGEKIGEKKIYRRKPKKMMFM